MFDWLKRKVPEPTPPPQKIESGQWIHGNLFPKNTVGFIKFDYNTLFQNIPWTPVKSTWDFYEIKWNKGDFLDYQGGKHPVSTTQKRGKIHRYWKQIGYFPCYLRVGKIYVPADDPIRKNSEIEQWPCLRAPKLPENTMVILYTGNVAVHEFCAPEPAEAGVYRHEFFVSALPDTVLYKYYPDYDIQTIFT